MEGEARDCAAAQSIAAAAAAAATKSIAAAETCGGGGFGREAANAWAIRRRCAIEAFITENQLEI